jgi:hypothetical protein
VNPPYPRFFLRTVAPGHRPSGSGMARTVGEVWHWPQAREPFTNELRISFAPPEPGLPSICQRFSRLLADSAKWNGAVGVGLARARTSGAAPTRSRPAERRCRRPCPCRHCAPGLAPSSARRRSPPRLRQCRGSAAALRPAPCQDPDARTTSLCREKLLTFPRGTSCSRCRGRLHRLCSHCRRCRSPRPSSPPPPRLSRRRHHSG